MSRCNLEIPGRTREAAPKREGLIAAMNRKLLQLESSLIGLFHDSTSHCSLCLPPCILVHYVAALCRPLAADRHHGEVSLTRRVHMINVRARSPTV